MQEYVNTGQLREDDVDSVLVNMGQPLLEVFLRRDEEADRLRTCSTVIVPADFAQVGRNMKSRLGRMMIGRTSP